MEIWALILTGLGLGMMVGLSGVGSAIGTVIGGQAVIGSMKKKPENFGLYLVLSALPATQGLYGFVGFFIYSGVVAAAGGASMPLFKAAILFGAGFALGIANLISAIKQGQVCASGISAIGSGHNVFGNTLILAAFPEFYAILSLVASILMTNLIK
ncbi:MAG TPA: ATPase [Spirochaetota bacterium]|nr:ATPase [Spirochaetota bacterium]